MDFWGFLELVLKKLSFISAAHHVDAFFKWYLILTEIVARVAGTLSVDVVTPELMSIPVKAISISS